MHARFYVPDLVEGNPAVDLPREEAEHLSRVLRLGVGDEVRVFDGRGHEFRGRIDLLGRSTARVTLVTPVTPVAEPAVQLTLAQAVPKGDAMERIVRDAVMLGVAAVVPLVSDRTQIPARRLVGSGRVDRWQRIAVASVKQCGRAVVPAVHPPMTLAACLHQTGGERHFLLAEPGLSPATAVAFRQITAGPVPASAMLIVGPEGGWSDQEVEGARRAGCVTLTLGARTLRADAAAAIGITALRCAWGDL
jgi:16S rRNA (uracil1498-N3)-methyltransferase